MQLYDTLSRELKTVRAGGAGELGVYTCGPTVYDYPHIGNWFTFIRYDLLVRTLKESGQDPKWVLNITDVGHLVSDADEGEDKLEKGARREGKTAQEIAEFYADYFIKGLERLNFLRPAHLPKATEHIAEQIEMIKELEEKGYTYRIDDGIYYDTARFADYAKLGRLDLDAQLAGARVEMNPQKKNQSDFALWKFSPKGTKRDMEWPSPWGAGFPGWHIECSAMIRKYFGDTVDVHSGGIDHVPVHHTNEIAQSQAVTGKPLAGVWMHTNHILINDEKISKSRGNSITLEDIQKEGFSLPAFRLLVLQSHYRTQSAFSWESLEAAQNRLNAYRAMAVLRWQTQDSADRVDFASFGKKFESAMRADLNTPQLLSDLSELENIVQVNLVDHSQQSEFVKLLEKIDALTGLALSKEADISDAQKELINERSAARVNQDWEQSDKLRQTLEDQRVLLRDTPSGAVWYRA